MLLVAVLTPTMAIGAVVAIFVLLPAGMVLGPALALGIGALAVLIVHHTRKEPPGRSSPNRARRMWSSSSTGCVPWPTSTARRFG
jgi:hypothetical protein